MDTQRTIRPRENILVQELDGELVMLNLDTEHYFALNGVATRIWEVLSTTSSLDEAVTMLLSEYDVDEATLRQDIYALIGSLEESGIIEA